MDETRTSNASGGPGSPQAILDGKYRIERIIGEGAFGRVYLATDTRLRRPVAVKELLATRSGTEPDVYERYLDRFGREARAGGAITNSNVVTVYEMAVDPERNTYLVMEYVDGTNLRDLLAQVGALPVERAVAIARDIAHGLGAVHDMDIVHRDLKPANVMISRRGDAKVGDFGVAQVGTESQRTQATTGHPGTPMYMSPEQSSGTGYLDGRSDLYSLGLILYEMLAGEPFVRRRTPLAQARPDAPPALVATVERLLQREPDYRYGSAAEVAAELSRPSVAPQVGGQQGFALPPAGGFAPTGFAPGSGNPPPNGPGYGSRGSGAPGMPPVAPGAPGAPGSASPPPSGQFGAQGYGVPSVPQGGGYPQPQPPPLQPGGYGGPPSGSSGYAPGGPGNYGNPPTGTVPFNAPQYGNPPPQYPTGGYGPPPGPQYAMTGTVPKKRGLGTGAVFGIIGGGVVGLIVLGLAILGASGGSTTATATVLAGATTTSAAGFGAFNATAFNATNTTVASTARTTLTTSAGTSGAGIAQLTTTAGAQNPTFTAQAQAATTTARAQSSTSTAQAREASGTGTALARPTGGAATGAAATVRPTVAPTTGVPMLGGVGGTPRPTATRAAGTMPAATGMLYTDPEKKYTFRIPAGFIAQMSETDDVDAELINPSPLGIIRTTATDTGTALSLDLTTAAVVAGLRSNFSTFMQSGTTQNATVNGTPAKRVDFNFTDSGVKLQAAMYVVSKNGYTVAIFFFAQPGELDPVLQAGKTVLDSFTFL